MEEGNLILIVVAVIGFIQVGFAGLLAYLTNRNTAEATANKDNESVYAGLVDRLEKTVERADARILILEEKCERYERLLDQYENKDLPLDE